MRAVLERVSTRGLLANWQSFAEVIGVGSYAQLCGFAESPEEIRGQVIHPVSDFVPTVRRYRHRQALGEMHVRHQSRMPTLAEFLEFGTRHQEFCARPRFSADAIGISWSDERGKLWYAQIIRVIPGEFWLTIRIGDRHERCRENFAVLQRGQ